MDGVMQEVCAKFSYRPVRISVEAKIQQLKAWKFNREPGVVWRPLLNLVKPTIFKVCFAGIFHIYCIGHNDRLRNSRVTENAPSSSSSNFF
jgi:hypothetical protein